MNGENSHDHFFDVIRGFDEAMLVTFGGQQPHCRPMAIAAIEGDEILFVTSTGSPKADEVRADGHATVVMQGKTQFATAWGKARIEDDRGRIARLWKSAWKVWFPKGKDDPDLRLVVVRPDGGEYWDNSGAKGARYVLEAAKALVNGKRPSTDREQHGKVALGS